MERHRTESTPNEQDDKTSSSPSDVSSDDHTLLDAAPPSSEASLPGTLPGETESSLALSQSLRDRYRLIRVLGRGGFGIVYLAHDRILDQDVAIKVLKLGLSSKSDRQRFISEARIGAKLRHPAIVNVFDIVQSEEGMNLVMEYYPGGTLAELIKKHGKVRPREAFEYARQICSGLAYAHRKNVIHRDIKPANIFLAGDDQVKLGDFGICKHIDLGDNTHTGEVMGTPLYMAPEQTRDSKGVDPRADIYALGMTLYHMLTGRPPRVLDLDLLDADFRPLIKKATAHDRNERPVSAEQFMAMIEQTARLHEEKRRQARAGGAASATPSSAASAGPVPTPTSDPTSPTVKSESGPAPDAGFGPPGLHDEATVTQHAPPSPTPTPTTASPRSSNWTLVAVAAIVALGMLSVVWIMQGGLKSEGEAPEGEIGDPIASPFVVPDAENEEPESAQSDAAESPVPGNGAPPVAMTPEAVEQTPAAQKAPEKSLAEEPRPPARELPDLRLPFAEPTPFAPPPRTEDILEQLGANGTQAQQAFERGRASLRDWFQENNVIFLNAALASLKTAVELDPEKAAAHYWLGRAWEERFRWEQRQNAEAGDASRRQALSHYAEYLRRDPEHEAIREFGDDALTPLLREAMKRQ